MSATSPWTCARVEQIQFNALGGADTVTVKNLSGTGVNAASPSTWRAARQRHRRRYSPMPSSSTARPTTTHVTVTGGGTSPSLSRDCPPQVIDQRQRGANDALVVNTLGGNDKIDASGLAAGVTSSHDRCRRRQRHHHRQRRRRRADRRALATTSSRAAAATTSPSWAMATTVRLEPGRWQRHGRGSGRHRHAASSTASNVNENIDIAANGSRVRLFRDVGSVRRWISTAWSMSSSPPSGGADTITVNDLTGTSTRSWWRSIGRRRHHRWRWTARSGDHRRHRR